MGMALIDSLQVASEQAVEEYRHHNYAITDVVDMATLRWLIPLALLHALLYLAIVPPWQHYDEPGHFAYVHMFVPGMELFSEDTGDLAIKREIADSMYRFNFWSPGYQPNLFVPLSPDIGVDQTTVHPPLYYAVTALPVRVVRYLSIETQLYSARSVAVVLSVLTVVIAWRLSGMVMPQQPLMHLVVPLVLMLVPAFSALMSAVNNDAMVNFSTAALFLACVWLIRDGIRPAPLLLAVLSLLVGIFAKRTALIGVIPFSLALFWAVYRRPVPWWIWLSGGITMTLLVGYSAFELFPPVTVDGTRHMLQARPWLVSLDQTYLRLQIDNTFRSLLDWQNSRQIYPQLLQVVFFSFWVRLGWGHVSLGWPGDLLILVIVVAGGTGLIKQGAHLRHTLTLWQQRCILLFSVTAVVALLATMVRVHPLPPPGSWVYIPVGRYMHLVLLPIVWLLVLGIQGLLPQRWQPVALFSLVGGFVVLDIFAWAVILPTYYYR